MNNTNEIAELLQPLADRWNETPEWHNPPFLDGRIEITTGHLKAIAELLAALQAEPVEVCPHCNSNPHAVDCLWVKAMAQARASHSPQPAKESEPVEVVGWNAAKDASLVSGYFPKGARFYPAPQPAKAPEELVKQMVDRFLSWRLPDDFHPDGGIEFTPPPAKFPAWWPAGTNLFNAEQAKAMVEHMLGAAAPAAEHDRCKHGREMTQVCDSCDIEAEDGRQAEPVGGMPAWYGMDNAWPLHTVLHELAEAAKILLDDKGWDGHGHEGIRIAQNRACEILSQLGLIDYTPPQPAKVPEVGDIVEWDEPDGCGGFVKLRADVIEHNGELWLNGCGSFKGVDKQYRWEVVGNKNELTTAPAAGERLNKFPYPCCPTFDECKSQGICCDNRKCAHPGPAPGEGEKADPHLASAMHQPWED